MSLIEKRTAGRSTQPAANSQNLQRIQCTEYYSLNASRLYELRELWWRSVANGIRLPPQPGIIILDGGRA
jgi:hypothetical protein